MTAQESHAARLGMWAFLVSELMLFAALLALYAAQRANFPEGFAAGVRHNHGALGTANTYVLVTSSFTVALALHAARSARGGRAALWLGATIVLGTAFLGVKAFEYAAHFREGIVPGGALEGERGMRSFFQLYYGATGLHALHVIGGMAALAWLARRAARGDFGPERDEHLPLELGGLYWHFVDVVWIFLWPLFYLLG